jgi:hypothetical protein
MINYNPRGAHTRKEGHDVDTSYQFKLFRMCLVLKVSCVLKSELVEQSLQFNLVGNQKEIQPYN